MAGIFTRPELTKIINNADLTPEERVDQIFSLYGRAVDDGYITRKAAEAAQTAAVDAAKAEWEKNVPKVDVKTTPEYIELQGQFDGYKAKESARNSPEYKDVKPKFFDRVYDMIDRKEGAKPVSEQMAGIKKDFEEFFNPAEPAPKFPTFGARPEGTGVPTGNEGAVSTFVNAWNFSKKP